MTKALKIAAEIRKALLAAAAVASTLAVTVGVPHNVQTAAGEVAAVLAAGGITWRVPNKPAA